MGTKISNGFAMGAFRKNRCVICDRIGTSATLCVGSPYVFSGMFYEFVNKNKKRYNFETA